MELRAKVGLEWMALHIYSDYNLIAVETKESIIPFRGMIAQQQKIDVMTLWGERIAAGLCISFALFMAWTAWNFPAAGDQFPLFSCGSIILISILMILRTFLQPGVFTQKFEFGIKFEDLKPLIITVIVVLYVRAIFELGYYTSSFIFLIFMTLFVGVRNYKMIALTAVILFPLMYAFFELFLRADMPRGILI